MAKMDFAEKIASSIRVEYALRSAAVEHLQDALGCGWREIIAGGTWRPVTQVQACPDKFESPILRHCHES